MDKDYANRVFTRATVEDKHGDLCANDYGEPAKLHYTDYKPMTKQETEDYYEKLAEIELDTITF